jgi:hypothetical protein
MHTPHSSVARLDTQRLYFIAEATKFPNHSCRAAGAPATERHVRYLKLTIGQFTMKPEAINGVPSGAVI